MGIKIPVTKYQAHSVECNIAVLQSLHDALRGNSYVAFESGAEWLQIL